MNGKFVYGLVQPNFLEFKEKLVDVYTEQQSNSKCHLNEESKLGVEKERSFSQ